MAVAITYHIDKENCVVRADGVLEARVVGTGVVGGKDRESDGRVYCPAADGHVHDKSCIESLFKGSRQQQSIERWFAEIETKAAEAPPVRLALPKTGVGPEEKDDTEIK